MPKPEGETKDEAVAALSRAVANIVNRTGGMEPVVPYTPRSGSTARRWSSG